MLFLLRIWDNFIHVYQADSFRLPKKKHAPLTTKEMKQRLQDSLDIILKTAGYTLDGELTWTRPHPPIGLAVFSIQTTTKYAPEFLGVSMLVGFRVPILESAIESVCRPMIIAGGKQEYPFVSQLLHRAYRDPERPKKQLPFPMSFMLWNVDFRESVVEEIKNTIRLYVFPFFDRVRTVSDLMNIGVSIENQAALLVWMNDIDAALKLLDIELQNKRYIPEMRARLKRLQESIASGELQEAVLAYSKN